MDGVLSSFMEAFRYAPGRSATATLRSSLASTEAVMSTKLRCTAGELASFGSIGPPRFLPLAHILPLTS